VLSGERRTLVLRHNCELRAVTDDMALRHPLLGKHAGRLALIDAEQGWFVRVNHITHYGTDPQLEKMTIHPTEPILLLNIDAHPGSTALIWEHNEDEPGKPCPNPRVVVPRKAVPGVYDGAVSVDVRSFGVRCPPNTQALPTYGIVGLFHLLPPALAWLWRLVAPRGHANPGIVSTEGMTSEGVGSYWPFATGRMVDQANLLLDQIVATPRMKYILCPKQHVGAWETGFMVQRIAREFLSRRGGAHFSKEQITASRCPLLSYTMKSVVLEGQTMPGILLRVENQPEVGIAAYDQGARMLTEFFHKDLTQFLAADLNPFGRKIIECCLAGGSVDDYVALLPIAVLEEDN